MESFIEIDEESVLDGFLERNRGKIKSINSYAYVHRFSGTRSAWEEDLSRPEVMDDVWACDFEDAEHQVLARILFCSRWSLNEDTVRRVLFRHSMTIELRESAPA